MGVRVQYTWQRQLPKMPLDLTVRVSCHDHNYRFAEVKGLNSQFYINFDQYIDECMHGSRSVL